MALLSYKRYYLSHINDLCSYRRPDACVVCPQSNDHCTQIYAVHGEHVVHIRIVRDQTSLAHFTSMFFCCILPLQRYACISVWVLVRTAAKVNHFCYYFLSVFFFRLFSSLDRLSSYSICLRHYYPLLLVIVAVSIYPFHVHHPHRLCVLLVHFGTK